MCVRGIQFVPVLAYVLISY